MEVALARLKNGEYIIGERGVDMCIKNPIKIIFDSEGPLFVDFWMGIAEKKDFSIIPDDIMAYGVPKKSLAEKYKEIKTGIKKVSKNKIIDLHGRESV